MSNMSGKELFAELKLRDLKKLSSKELEDTIAINLPALLEFYFFESFKKEELKFENAFIDLTASMKYFIKPLKRLVKISKKKKNQDDIPDGLHVLLCDSLDKVYHRVQKRIKSFEGGGRLTPETEQDISNLQSVWLELRDSVGTLCIQLNKKRIGKLKKLGIHEEYAASIAAAIVPKQYLNEYNVKKYIFRLLTSMYSVQKSGVVPDGDDGDYVNNVGANLASKSVIKEILEMALRGAERKVVINALAGIMLEKRGETFNTFTKPQLSLYNAVTNLVLDILEGEEVLNTDGKSIKGKKGKDLRKDLTLKAKDLKKFFAIFAEERKRDMKKHKDSVRRISFTNLADDAYPHVVAAFNKASKGRSEELLESTDAERAVYDQDDRKNDHDNGGRPNNTNGERRRYPDRDNNRRDNNYHRDNNRR